MNLIQQFVNFLLNQNPKPSLLTVKNYKADISQFASWCEKEFKSSFDGSRITSQIIEQYKKSRNLSPSSIERHMSSLRKFFNFLKERGVSIINPLERRTVSAEILTQADPWMIRNFKSFLHEYKKSDLTIKNYINDIKNFFVWLEEVALTKYSWKITDKNLLNKISSSVIEEYKQRLLGAKFLPSTINRRLSSLRNYISWAKSQGLISQCHPAGKQTALPSNEILKPVQYEKETYSPFPPARLAQKSLKGVNSLFDNLLILPLAQTIETVQRFSWKVSGKKLFNKALVPSPNHEEISNIKREFYAPLSISTHYLPAHKRIWHFLRHARPNWYKKYHSYSFTHYFHFSILAILSCVVGLGIYNRIAPTAQEERNILGVSTTVPSRILSFQGKLTDPTESPITTETSVIFSLYDDENAPTIESLWQENNTVKPDSNGVFSVLLGKKTPISETIFSRNSKLFLGIAVGNSPELRPRQELATVSLASNAESLQGLTPITNTDRVANVVLALDSGGNLSIAGSKAHTFQTIGGNFVLSGKVLSLTTVPGSNSNIEIVPDGMGKIDLSRPIQNSSDYSNLASAVGSVEFDDTVAILATTSAQSALYINQNSTGPLISASTSGTAKFVVENDGTGRFSGDLTVNGGDITSTATTFNFLNSTVTTLNLGNSEGTTYIRSNLTADKDFTLTSLTSNGGILYTNGSGKIYQAQAGSSSDCFTGGATPSFTSCSKIFNQASNVGIGTSAPAFLLDVQDNQPATAAARIFNTNTGTDADGLVIKLGNTSTSIVAASNHFASFETAGIGIVGSVQGNSGTGVTYATSGIADFAEYLRKDKDAIIEFGSVICLKDNGLAVKCDDGNNKIIGVASERPAFLGGKNLGNGSIAVALVGQVETLVAIANGKIKAGDNLTASDIPGVAIKTTKAGQIIGKALEDLDSIDESKTVGYFDPDNKEYRSKTELPNIPLKATLVRVAKIAVLINISWYDPGAYLAQNGDFIISSTGSNGYSVSNSNNETLTNLGGFFEVIAANIRAGLVQASEIITSSLIVTSDSIIVNGQNLKNYIVNVVSESGIMNQESRITSPVINTSQLAANVISPLGESLIVRLATPSAEIHDSQFIIQNSSGSAVASIDDSGKIIANKLEIRENLNAQSASISGNLNAGDASISGTLRAGNIIADSITGLEAKISSIYSTNFANIASYSAQFSYVPDLAAERAQFNQGLMVFGPTSLSDLALAGRLSIGGTMFITENSIEALGADLSLQSLRQGGLSVMGGLVYIDTEGNVKIEGNLSVTGKLAVNIISPLPSADLVVNNASGSSILSINQAGDVVASGSGTFAKLNFNLVAPVLAISSTEVIASSSAGATSIAPFQSEITIRNALVTNKSVIYITPVGTPSAQTPFLMRQQGLDSSSSQFGSFTVGVQSPTNHSLDFNWLIVN